MPARYSSHVTGAQMYGRGAPSRGFHCLESGSVGHVHVEEDHVRHELAGAFDGFPSRRHRGQHLVAATLELLREQLPCTIVVFGDEDPYRGQTRILRTDL